MNLITVFEDWGIEIVPSECVRDMFGYMLSAYPHNCFYIDTCPKSVCSGKYEQSCNVWYNYRVFKHRNKAYISNENKFVTFMRTMWLYNDTRLVECSLSRKTLRRMGFVQNMCTTPLDDIEVVESLLRYSLRHELEEVCFFLADMSLLVFPMGTCLLLVVRNTSPAILSFIEKVANVSGLFLRNPN